MPERVQAALVQLGVFLVCGILAPLGHLARHRADHTHGPDGGIVALTGHELDHHSHHHEAEPHEHEAEDHDDDHDGSAPVTRPVLPLDHGHGSISHLGLALLGAPPALVVPRPEPRENRDLEARTAEARLFTPVFPRPRPPPAPALALHSSQ
jgi:hypothetical protein